MQAWSMLRDDRHYGSMGGLSRIHYTALSCYAGDHGLCGDHLDMFVTILHGMDSAYIDHVLAKQKTSNPD